MRKWLLAEFAAWRIFVVAANRRFSSVLPPVQSMNAYFQFCAPCIGRISTGLERIFNIIESRCGRLILFLLSVWTQVAVRGSDWPDPVFRCGSRDLWPTYIDVRVCGLGLTQCRSLMWWRVYYIYLHYKSIAFCFHFHDSLGCDFKCADIHVTCVRSLPPLAILAFSLRSRATWIELGVWGERCKLSQRGTAVCGGAPVKNRILCILALKTRLPWQQF